MKMTKKFFNFLILFVLVNVSFNVYAFTNDIDYDLIHLSELENELSRLKNEVHITESVDKRMNLLQAMADLNTQISLHKKYLNIPFNLIE